MSTASQHSNASRGGLVAAATFFIWGVVPIYWKQMESVSAFELVAHRIVWSLLFLFAVNAWRKSFAELRPAFTDARIFFNMLIASLVLCANWNVYVWGVNNGQVIETSLGYFLTPLCNVALGFVFLHERLRTLQWTAIGFAVAGVAVLLLRAGHVPWIALSLAGTWSVYGMFKKRSTLGPIASLTAETITLAPFAVAVLIWMGYRGVGALGHADARVMTFIFGMGVVTSVPLLMFAYAVKRLRLATLGVFQYIAPTVQFLIGLLLYHEPFDSVRFQACVLIWCGLVIYTADSFWTQRNKLWAPSSATPVPQEPL